MVKCKNQGIKSPQGNRLLTKENHLGQIFQLAPQKATNLNNLIKGKVNKESRKAIKELENTLNNTHRTSDGNLNFMSGVSEDPESVFKGYTLDI